MKPGRDVAAAGGAAAGTGVALTAALASACCVGPSLAPIAISVLGASGLIAVSRLRPYAPVLFGVSAVLLALSFRQSSPARAAAACSPAMRRRFLVARVITWIAATIWMLAVIDSLYGYFHE